MKCFSIGLPVDFTHLVFSLPTDFKGRVTFAEIGSISLTTDPPSHRQKTRACSSQGISTFHSFAKTILMLKFHTAKFKAMKSSLLLLVTWATALVIAGGLPNGYERVWIWYAFRIDCLRPANMRVMAPGCTS